MNRIIKQEVESFPNNYPSFRDKADNYVLNGLAVKYIYYKNPSLVLNDDSLKSIVVDGTGDNGIDCILTDESSDHNDLVFIQCKYYDSISLEQIKAAISKMISAYSSLKQKRYDQFNDDVVSQFIRCSDAMEEGAKTKFVFVTSSPRNRTQTRSIINHFNQSKNDLQIEMDENCIFFEEELVETIEEAKSLRPCVEHDKLKIDSPDNVLYYGEDGEGAVLNVSACSLKELYGRYHNTILSQNLRFFVKNKTIDKDVDESIKNKPDEFWFKNNGITIICDDYELSSKVVKLTNFSIINGGQTTRKIYDSSYVNAENDFYLLCRIIKNPHSSKDDKQQFIYEVSKATNSQKAIKPSDLRANNTEQKLFEGYMLRKGVFYRTKRGMEIPASYKEPYQNCDLPKAGKLALSGLFLMPGSSRNRPSIIYDDQQSFYDIIFKHDTMDQIAAYISDLLYIDWYFDKKFIAKYRKDTISEDKKRFAGNCRTFVSAFTGFLLKYYLEQFTTEDLSKIANCHLEDQDDLIKLQKILRKMDKCDRIFVNPSVDLDKRDSILEKIFKYAINKGYDQYSAYKNQSNQDAVDETNWLKRDNSFYQVIKPLVDSLNDDLDEAQLSTFKELFVKE